MRRLRIGVLLILGTVVLVGCGGQDAAAPSPDPEPVEKMAPDIQSASAELQSREGFTVTGGVGFRQAADGGMVTITASVQGASAGSYGLHIHEIGDCSVEDFTSAGGHFDPAGVPHGGPMDAERHSGDLGNIEVGEDGSGTLHLTSDLITLALDQPTSIVGRAVILHEGADDLASQPTGAAGGRIACGVIIGGVWKSFLSDYKGPGG